MPDPSTFLSTIAATSAAMVAIVGGLLVARFVAIASEQEGAQRLLTDAEDRLAMARKRATDAREDLREWDTREFFGGNVIQAIRDGERDVQALREISFDGSLTDDEIANTVQAIADEFDLADATLKPMLAGKLHSEDFPAWLEAKHDLQSILPDTDWDDVWEIAYEDIVRPPGSARSRPITSLDVSSFINARPMEYTVLDIQRRDALQDDAARSAQQAEDFAAEVARLQRTRDAIVRPKGLGGGLVVLSFFTVVGVLFPIWLMSRAPKQLTAHLGEVVFWLFFAGLLVLFIYMGALALRLSGWRQTASARRDQRSSEANGANDPATT